MKSLKPLSSTYLFNLYDKTTHLNDIMLKLIKDSVKLTEEDLIDYIGPFERRYNFPLKNKTIQDFRAGNIVVVYNMKDYKLPNAIPCFLINTGNTVKCIVNVTNYMTKNKKDNSYKIDPKILYSLMQGGTILALCYQKHKIMQNKVNIIKYGSIIYSELFSKMMNKMFTLSINPAKNDIIIFLSSLFFIQNMLGRDSESLEEMNIKYAADNCKGNTRRVLDDYIDKFDFQKDLADFDTFINAMAKNIPGLEDLTTKSFTEQFMLSYGANMLMSLEYLPTFIHNLACVEVGSFLNNQNYIENQTGKFIESFLAELSNL